MVCGKQKLGLLLLLFAESRAFGRPELTVLSKTNQRFDVQELTSSRKSESFETTFAPGSLSKDLTRTFRQVVALLPSEFHPEATTVYLEWFADVRLPDGSRERLPMSLVTTMVNPADHSIRVGTYEFEHDRSGMMSLFAHETGHMLVEWACRQSGVTSPDDFLMTHWSQDIYEGVADFISAAVMRKPFVGSNVGWFRRNLSQYRGLTFDEAKVDRLSIRLARVGMKQVGLTPNFRGYSWWVHWLGDLFSNPVVQDPYAGGLWLADHLWRQTENERANKLIERIIRLAATGKRFEDPRTFLDALKIEM